MKWVIKYKDGDQIHNYRHERYNDVGEWLGNGEIMFFDTEQKAKDYLSTLDSREYYRWIEKYQSITKNKCDTFNIKDIQKAGINLEHCLCIKCNKKVVVNFTLCKLPIAFCEYCGYEDVGYLECGWKMRCKSKQ